MDVVQALRLLAGNKPLPLLNSIVVAEGHPNRFAVLEFLILNGVPLNSLEKTTIAGIEYECTPLQAAALLHDIDTLSYLLHKGSDAKITDSAGRSTQDYISMGKTIIRDGLEEPSEDSAMICSRRLAD